MCLLQVLGQAGADIPIHAKNGDIDEFGAAVGQLATAVCQITEAGAQVRLNTHCMALHNTDVRAYISYYCGRRISTGTNSSWLKLRDRA